MNSAFLGHRADGWTEERGERQLRQVRYMLLGALAFILLFTTFQFWVRIFL